MTSELETPRLKLEWYSPALAQAVLAGERRTDWAPRFPSPGELKAGRWIVIDGNAEDHAPFLAYTIRERSSGLLIGGAGFHNRPVDRCIELGYGLVEDYWGRGFASEACAALRDAAFASGDVDVVIATTDPDNSASQAVLRRCGFLPSSPALTSWSVRPS